MKNSWILLIAFVVAGAAHAQFRWVDKDGKVRYGDTPPPGVKATALGAPASGSAPAAASKDAKKGPLSNAERDQEFRKRQDAGRKDQDKEAQELQAKAERAEDCTRAREYLRTLESGQRISRTDSAGERYYLNEGQTVEEITKSKRAIQLVCNK